MAKEVTSAARAPQGPDHLAVVNASGYPLQAALARTVAAESKRHGWRVLYEEHSWANRYDGSSGYLDLVLEQPNFDLVLLIECKRLQNKEWILLPPYGAATLRRHAKALMAVRQNGKLNPPQAFWSDEALEPRTPEAMFCVTPKDARDPTLERVSAELVSATEALADEEGWSYLDGRGGNSRRCYFAAVVTTAHLTVCEFDPSTVSLEDGKIPDGATFASHNTVRFTKQLSTRPQGISGKPAFGAEANALASAKDRTVFVVRAPYLNRFLSNFAVDGRS